MYIIYIEDNKTITNLTPKQEKKYGLSSTYATYNINSRVLVADFVIEIDYQKKLCTHI